MEKLTASDLLEMVESASLKLSQQRQRDLRWALRRALMVALKAKYPLVVDDELERQCEVRPVLQDILATAQRDSNRNATGLVRAALVSIAPQGRGGRGRVRMFYGDRLQIPDAWLTDSWREVVELADSLPKGTGRTIQLLRYAARNAMRHGWMSPKEMPTSAEMLIGSLVDSGYSMNDSTWIVHRLIEVGRTFTGKLPCISQRPFARGSKDRLGLRAIAEHTTGLLESDHDDVLRCIAPRIAAEWDKFKSLNDKPRRGQTPRSHAAVDRVFSGLRKVVRVLYEGAASEARHYETGKPLAPLSEVTLLDLVWCNVPRAITWARV